MLFHSKRAVTATFKSYVPIDSSFLSLTEVHKPWPEAGLKLKAMVTWKHCDTDAGIFTHCTGSISTVTQWKQSSVPTISLTTDTATNQHRYHNSAGILFSWRVPVLARKDRSVWFCVLGAFLIHPFLSCPSNSTARADPRHVHVGQVRSVIALTGVFFDIKVI